MEEYKELANKFFETSCNLKKLRQQKSINESFKGEIFALLYLKNKGEYILPSDISDEMEISTARVTAILNNLEDKKLIERKIDKKDRRKIQVKLTILGEEKANKHNEDVIQHIVDMFKLLGKEDSREFVRIVSKIVNLTPGESKK